MFLPILGIILIIGALGYVAYTGQTNSVINGLGSAFDTITYKEGNFELTILNQKSQTQPHNTVTKVSSDITDTPNTLNGTSTELIITEEQIPTYSVSNIPPIIGYITLYDPTTNSPLKPYSYDYRLVIECNDTLNDFCNLMASNRGSTTNAGTDDEGNELGGKYEWNWSLFQTQASILPANTDFTIYDVTVFVDGISESGYFETFEKTYQIKIIP
jgi:hypothetical protein